MYIENRCDRARDGYLLEISSSKRKYIVSMNENPVRMRQRRKRTIILCLDQMSNWNQYFCIIRYKAELYGQIAIKKRFNHCSLERKLFLIGRKLPYRLRPVRSIDCRSLWNSVPRALSVSVLAFDEK